MYKYDMIHFDNPYGGIKNGIWIKGNLHAHTTRSDGELDPQEIIDEYASRGYAFLMLSDHDYFTSLTELKKYRSESMVLIPGNEITSKNGPGTDRINYPHILNVDAQRSVAANEDRQLVLKNIREQGGFAILCHPNWLKDFNHCSQKNILEWEGYLGIEIFNGTLQRHPGSPYAMDRWDMVLSNRKRVWGFSGDDAHKRQEIGLGWNMAYVQEISLKGVVQALRQGAFYASTGVIINNIQVVRNTIRIETENAEKIVAIADFNFRIHEVKSKCVQFEYKGVLPETFRLLCHPDGKARYVRFECWGKGEEFAWTQPFFLNET